MLKINRKILIGVFTYLATAILGALAQVAIEKFILHREKVKLWSVDGCLKLEDRDQFDSKDTVLSIKPPDQDLYESGQFVIDKVPIKIGEGGKPSLLIKKDNYKVAEVVLEEKCPEYYENFSLKNYSVKYQKKDKKIEIKKPIYLEREDASR